MINTKNVSIEIAAESVKKDFIAWKSTREEGMKHSNS
jgi:hypothetical protein